MRKSKKSAKGHSAAKRTRVFRAALFAAVLLAAGVVTVEVGGKRLRVNALTLQQGPLTQEQSQQIADALKENKSTDGLVEVRHADGTVSVDLQGRFQNVTLARKNDDGSVSEACVDNPEAPSGTTPAPRSASSGSTPSSSPRTSGARRSAAT